MKSDNDNDNAPTGASPLDPGAELPAAEPADASMADGNMGQLRQLLFGSQMRDYDQRFKDLAERQSTELTRLRDEQRARVEKLDAFVRGEFDRLSGELRREREERLSAAQQLGDHLEALHRDLGRDLGARIDTLTTALGYESRNR